MGPREKIGLEKVTGQHEGHWDGSRNEKKKNELKRKKKENRSKGTKTCSGLLE